MATEMIVYQRRFEDLLSVLDDEQLIRLTYRLCKVGKEETAGELERELATREENANRS